MWVASSLLLHGFVSSFYFLCVWVDLSGIVKLICVILYVLFPLIFSTCNSIFSVLLFLKRFFCTQLHDIKNLYLLQIICIQSYNHIISSINSNNYAVSSNYFYLIVIICLHTVIQFQVINNIPQ